MTSKFFSRILTAAPFILLVFCVCRYSVDVPKVDEWREVDLIERFLRSGLNFPDLWSSHNGHRLVFPRLIQLACVKWTHWDLFYLYGLDILFAVGIFFILGAMIRQMRPILGEKIIGWLIPLVSVMVFSLHQWKNWMKGFNLMFCLSILGAAGSIFFLSQKTFRWKNFLPGQLGAIVAAFSCASGIAVLPAAFFSLLFVHYKNKSEKICVLCLWSVFSCALMSAYFYHLHVQLPYRPSIFYDIGHPSQLARYYFIFLGNSFWAGAWTRGGTVPFYMGLAGFVFLMAAIIGFFASPRFRETFHVGFVSIGIVSAAAALMAALTRVGLGLGQALSSRYTTISYPLWIFVAVCLAWVFRCVRLSAVRKAALGFLIFTAGLAALTSLAMISHIKEDNRMYARARQELFVLKDDTVLESLGVPASLVREKAPVLRSLGLSVFRAGSKP